MCTIKDNYKRLMYVNLRKAEILKWVLHTRGRILIMYHALIEKCSENQNLSNSFGDKIFKDILKDLTVNETPGPDLIPLQLIKELSK